jgi:hypothetical protein
MSGVQITNFSSTKKLMPLYQESMSPTEIAQQKIYQPRVGGLVLVSTPSLVRLLCIV